MVETCDITTTFTPQPWCGKHLNDNEPNVKYVYNYASKKYETEKTPMCRIAEITRFNKIKHEYILLDEEGPAHKKRFTVKLKIGDENYEGNGASIKKAQQAAAAEALKHCTLPKPPEKSKKSKKDPTNLCTLLFHCAHQIGIKATFKDMNLPSIQDIHLMQPSKRLSYLNMPSNSVFLPQTSPQGTTFPFMRMPPNLPRQRPFFRSMNFTPQRMMVNPYSSTPVPQPRQLMNSQMRMISNVLYKFIVKLSDGTEHVGEPHSNKTDAKYSAAKKALKYLLPELKKLMEKLATNDSSSNNSSNSSETSETSAEEEDNKENKSRIENLVENQQQSSQINSQRVKHKSVVSQVHESALRLRMNVEFEVVKETGEAHKRKYVMKCTLNAEDREPIVSIGEGSSKKNAKQSACREMLEQLKGIEEDPIYLATVVFMSNKRANSISKENKRKTIIKDMKMDPQYGHHINPISRLVQVTQTKKIPDPMFTVINEQGQNRYKEFTVQVYCDGVTLTGVGPNKRLAKRSAAEAMLRHIGYIKPLPQPGKSLLKKKDKSPEETLIIGVFDPNEVNKNVENDIHKSKNETFSNTFVEINNSIKEIEINKGDKISPKLDDEEGKLRKRRVTFSTQVSECPPPEDSTYPEASITSLKSEVVCVTKPKKRGKDSKKVLTEEDKCAIAQLCRDFLAYPLATQEKKGFVSRDMDCGQFQLPLLGTVILTAKERLESLATSFKFSVTYSDFPKKEKEQSFSLCSVGIEKPIVKHGSGDTEEDAHNDAAVNAIIELAKLDIETHPQSPLTPPILPLQLV